MAQFANANWRLGGWRGIPNGSLSVAGLALCPSAIVALACAFAAIHYYYYYIFAGFGSVAHTTSGDIISAPLIMASSGAHAASSIGGQSSRKSSANSWSRPDIH